MPAGLFKGIFCACGFVLENLLSLQAYLREFAVPAGLFKGIFCACRLVCNVLFYMRVV